MNIDAFLQTLPIIFYGLGGIFAVIIVIILCVRLLTSLFPARRK